MAAEAQNLNFLHVHLNPLCSMQVLLAHSLTPPFRIREPATTATRTCEFVVSLMIVVFYREEVIMTKWDKLIGKLEARRKTLVGFRDLVGLFREMDGAHGDMQDIEVMNLIQVIIIYDR